jgi:vacuole morphology and inheritance protein 14
VHLSDTCNGAQLTWLQEVARYLEEIVPPVLACFGDADARVRYYACESMYNIAKVAKGEVLVYFNQVFDALCKVDIDITWW